MDEPARANEGGSMNVQDTLYEFEGNKYTRSELHKEAHHAIDQQRHFLNLSVLGRAQIYAEKFSRIMEILKNG